MHTLRRYFAGTLAFLLLTFPLAPVYAQEASSTPLVDVIAPTPADTASSTPPVEQNTPPTQDTITVEALAPAADSSILSSDATSTQVTISADILVQTQDPTQVLTDTSASSTAPIDASPSPHAVDISTADATSTDATSTAVIPDSASIAVTDEQAPQQDVSLDAPPPQPAVADLPVVNIAPKKDFTFVIENERLSTSRTPAWKGKGEGQVKKGLVSADAPITTAPAVSLDATLNVPVVSGSCSKAYYVILLYKNATDYNTDPASYILNKAYPCQGGQYTYTVKDTPLSIPSGTYYLLVGEMGETGSWTPTTSLVPIQISRVE